MAQKTCVEFQLEIVVPNNLNNTLQIQNRQCRSLVFNKPDGLILNLIVQCTVHTPWIQIHN